MITINNPTQPFMDPPIDFTQWRRAPTYAIYQLEIGENGTPHLQMYAYFEKQILGAQLKNALGVLPHLEPRLGKHSEVNLISTNSDFSGSSFFPERQRLTVQRTILVCKVPGRSGPT